MRGTASRAVPEAKTAPRAHHKLVSPTSALILLNSIVFILMAASAHALLRFTGGQVLHFGGNYGPLTLSYQPWRLLTALFVHIGLMHLVVNMWALYELGELAEEVYGGNVTLIIYLLAGLSGSITSLARKPVIVSAGASGAIFGLAGALIATLAFRRLKVRSRELTLVLASLLAFVGYNLSYGLQKGGIDNGAHLGGLLAGLLLGTALTWVIGERPRASGRSQAYIFSTAVVVLAMSFGATRHWRGQAVAIEGARQALQQGDPDLAIRRLSSPQKTTEYFSLLAAAYTEKKQYAAAEANYERALQLDSKDFSAHAGLGLLLVGRGRLDEGRKELEEAVRLDPKAGGVWLELGILWQKQGRYQESVACLERAAALTPNSAAPQFALGMSQMNLRQYDRAIAAFQEATRLNPADYNSQIWLANAYEAKGLGQQAEAAYARAEQLRRASRLARRTR